MRALAHAGERAVRAKYCESCLQTRNPVFHENGTIETLRKQAKQTKIAEAQFADRCHA
jgi:hypothetical protein